MNEDRVRNPQAYEIVYDYNMPWRQQPFFQVALPIIVTFLLATWYQASRINDLRDSLGNASTIFGAT